MVTVSSGTSCTAVPLLKFVTRRRCRCCWSGLPTRGRGGSPEPPAHQSRHSAKPCFARGRLGSIAPTCCKFAGTACPEHRARLLTQREGSLPDERIPASYLRRRRCARRLPLA